MSKVLEKATSHFRSRISGEMKSIYVPEWETKIFFRVANTLKDESKIVELAQAGKTIEALVETVIMKARNEDGSKMFNTIDKVTFMNEIDPGVIIRVAGEIATASTADSDLGEVEKN